MANPYFPMFNSTVVLYNLYDGTWFPTVLSDCHVVTDRAAVNAAYGVQTGDNTILHALYSMSGNEIVCAGKKFLEPKAWKRNDDKSSVFTFGPNEDFFVLVNSQDAFEEIISSGEIYDEDYQNGTHLGFYDFMNHTYDNVYTVTSYAVYRFLKHFEVVAK